MVSLIFTPFLWLTAAVWSMCVLTGIEVFRKLQIAILHVVKWQLGQSLYLLLGRIHPQVFTLKKCPFFVLWCVHTECDWCTIIQLALFIAKLLATNNKKGKFQMPLPSKKLPECPYAKNAYFRQHKMIRALFLPSPRILSYYSFTTDLLSCQKSSLPHFDISKIRLHKNKKIFFLWTIHFVMFVNYFWKKWIWK